MVSLAPFAPALEPLSFATAAVSARRSDGTELALRVELREVEGANMRHVRRWARGHLPPGTYSGLVVRLTDATLARDDGPAALLTPAEPTFVAAELSIDAGRATTLALELDDQRALRDGYALRPVFEVVRPAAELPSIVGYVADAASHSLTVFDPLTRRAVGVVPTGRTPRGLALDDQRGRTYVALTGADAIDVVDIANGARLEPIRLEPGDEPHELALTPDGRTLLAVNHGSSTVAFLDPATGAELGRLEVGEGPSAIVIAPTGQRAYVLSQTAPEIAVIDVPNRSLVTTVPSATAPLRAQLDHDGTRLFVISQGAPELRVLSVPEYVEVERIQVGLGMTALAVDPATDLIYVAMRDSLSVLVYDPISLVPVDSLRVPAPITYLAVDDAPHALLAVMPALRSLASFDLTSRELVGLIDVGCAPQVVVTPGARR